jgi:transcriptional regulator
MDFFSIVENIFVAKEHIGNKIIHKLLYTCYILVNIIGDYQNKVLIKARFHICLCILAKAYLTISNQCQIQTNI